MKFSKKLLSHLKKLSLKRILVFLVIGLIGFVLFYYFSIIQKDKFIKSQAVNIYSNCHKDEKIESCYESSFSSFDKTHTFAQTLEVLSSLQDIDGKARGCHTIAHVIAEAEVAKNPAGWADLIKKIDIFACNGGYLHGIIEGHTLTDPKFVVSRESVDLLCRQLEANIFALDNCVHGMGHLMLVQYDGNIKPAVAECERIPSKWEYQCLDGIFMENLTRDFLVDHGIASFLPWTLQNSQNIERLCNSFAGLPQKECWRMISMMYVYIYNNNPKAVYNACLKAPTQDMAEVCYIYGVIDMEIVPNPNVQTFPSLCSFYDPETKVGMRCMARAINTLIYSSLKNFDETLHICASVESSWKKNCFNDLISALGDVKAEVSYVNTACNKAPEDFSNKLCVPGGSFLEIF